MRVLHVISSGGMYGDEAVILQLSAEMHRTAQNQSFLAVFSHAGQSAPALHQAALAAQVSSELVACNGQLDSSIPGKLRSLAGRVGAEIIHAHGYKADIYVYLAFRSARRPALVSTCHTWYDNDLAVRAYGALDRWVLRSFDEVVAVSEEVKQRLRGAGVKAERIALIRNGVSLSPPRDNAEDAEAARVRIGLVGRLAPEKGVDIFLRATALLAGRYPQADFVVAGDGPERANLESLLKQLGLGERVQLLGRQEDMQSVYASLDLLVSASRQEGLPMVLLEGMAAGLPVVATAVGEVGQVVASGETGLLVLAENPEALAAALEVMLSDAELRRQYGKAGRQRVQQEFSAERMTAEYLEVYQRALGRRSPKRESCITMSGVL